MKTKERKIPSEVERKSPIQGRVDYHFFSKISFIFSLVCGSSGGRIIRLSAGALRGQKRVLGPLELELQVLLKRLTGLWGKNSNWFLWKHRSAFLISVVF